MIFDLANPYEKAQAVELFGRLLGKTCVMELKERRPQRSSRQNSYLHVILGYFASEYGCSLEEAKVDFYKRECNRDLFERTMVNKHGREIRYLRSSKELSTEEMTTSIERFRNYSSAQAGIYLPSPGEEQYLSFCARQMEMNKEFV